MKTIIIKSTIVILLAILPAVCLLSQNFFSEPIDFTRPMSFSGQSADLDGDGIDEKIEISPFGFNKLLARKLTSDGVACEEEINVELDQGVRAFWLGEFNADGSPDIFVKDVFNNLHLFINDGNGFFNIANNPIDITPTNTLDAFAHDMNGDDLLDVVTQSELGDLLVYLNDGTGNLIQTIESSALGFFHTPYDVNQDGFDDLIYSRTDSLFMQLSSGLLYNTETLVLIEHSIIYGSSSTDLNSNDLLDFLYTGSGAILWRVEFTSDGSIINKHQITETHHLGHCVIDYDLDGDEDIVVAAKKDLSDIQEDGVYIYSNDGMDSFTIEHQFLMPIVACKVLDVLDMNNDGYEDIFIGFEATYEPAERDQSIWLENNGATPFVNKHEYSMLRSGGFQLIHNNITNLPDLIFTEYDYFTEYHYVLRILNDGAGNYCTPQRVFENVSVFNLIVLDANGDNIEDILFTNDDGFWVALADENNQFEMAQVSSSAHAPIRELIPKDFNDDGLMDVFVDKYNEFVIFENQGTGQFIEHVYPMEPLHYQYVYDVNLDGLLDLVSTEDTEIWWYENLDDFSFDEPVVITLAQYASPLFFVDIDNDQDSDLLYYNLGFPSNKSLYFLENTGEENFAPEVLVSTGVAVDNLREIDIDNDGISEVICLNENGINFLEYSNGAVSLSTLPNQDVYINRGLFSDIDGDGDKDLHLDGLRVIFNFSEIPQASFHVDNCPAFHISNNSHTNYSQSTFTWHYGDGTTSNGPEPQPSYTETGDYLLTLEVCNTQNLVCDTLSAEITYSHYVDVQHEPTGIAGEPLTFENMSEGYSDFSWVFGDGDISSDVSPDHTYIDPGTYSLELFLTDSTSVDCTNHYTSEIVISEASGIDVPTLEPSIHYNIESPRTIYFKNFDSNTFVNIYSLNGQFVEGLTISSNLHAHLVSDLTKGMYLFSASYKGRPFAKRIIIQ